MNFYFKYIPLSYSFLSLILAFSFTIIKSQNRTDYNYPESIIRKGNFLYITGDGKTPSPQEKNGDGVIKKLNLDGKIISENIAVDRLDSPKGTAIIGNIIYVADIDRVVGISLKTGKILKVISFTGKTKLLNDITQKNRNTLFVSATDVNKIFSVSINENIITELDIPEIKGCNGLIYNKKQNILYVAGFGKFGDVNPTGEVGKITWINGKPLYEKLISQAGFYDGIQLIKPDRLMVSDWESLDGSKGRIFEINLSSPYHITKEIETNISPADFFYDKKANILYIPNAMTSGLQTITL